MITPKSFADPGWQREHALSRALDARRDRLRIRRVSADLARAYHFLCAYCQRTAACAVQTAISSDRCDRLLFSGFARRRRVNALTADTRSGSYLRGYSGGPRDWWPRRGRPRLTYGLIPNGPSVPVSMRSDSNSAKALSTVNTSAPASWPRYLSTIGAAACCAAASR